MTDENLGKRRYLALWFPFLSAERLRNQEPDRCDTPPDAPLVFIARVKSALRLVAVDARAGHFGLAPGLTLADARVLQPDLRAVEMDEAADHHWLQRIALDCARWSPLVALDPPDGISIDISGVTHLFGGEAGLADAVADMFLSMRMTYLHATASTVQGAQALARYAALPVTDEHIAIRALPVAALGLDPAATLGLQRAGLKTIGDVAIRPAAGIAARFGMEAVNRLHMILGEARQPIVPLQHKARLRFERRFAEPVAHQAVISETLRALLHDAAKAMEEKGTGGRRFVMQLLRSDGARHRLRIETGAATRDPKLVLRLFDERIGTLADPLDPGFGYDSITLQIAACEPLVAVQPEFDREAQGDMAVAELVDRLSTRLGPGCIRRLVPQDSHVPEQAQLALPAIMCREPVPWPAAPAGEPPVRPLFLFDPPQQIEVIAEVPDGPPHRFRWRRNLHEVRLYEGPERIAAEWWRRKGGEHDGKGGLTRDYYRIEDVKGRRYWIFRHGLYDEKPDPRWYMHGLFA